MRLKSVELKGFRAYRDRVVVLTDKGSNAIVGVNGSGKSSLLEAISLVLSEVYGRKSVDPKQIVHKGVRHSLMTAYVELCFDNSDRKLSLVERDEVKLRRIFTVGGEQTKKDQFAVDGKKVTKLEFTSLLEAGGFSKTNPYYFVRQGKIIELSLMTDEGRLKLLKDFSGVQVYEEKREQADESLRDIEEKTAEIDLIITDLDGKLVDLETQQVELQRFQTLTQRKEQILLFMRETEMAQILQEKDTLKQKSAQVLADLASLETPGETLECLVSSPVLAEEKTRLETRREEVAKMLLDVEETQRMIRFKLEKSRAETSKNAAILARQEQLTSRLEAEIDTKARKLADSIGPAVQSTAQALLEAELSFSALNGQLNTLWEKKARCEKYSSVSERNKAIETSSVPCLKQKLSALEALGKQGVREIEERKLKIANLEASCEEIDRTSSEAIDAGEACRRADEIAEALREVEKQIRLREARLEDCQSSSKWSEAEAEKVLGDIQGIHRAHIWQGMLVALKSTSPAATTAAVVAQFFQRLAYIEQLRDDQLPPIIAPVWAIVQTAPRWRRAVCAVLGTALETLVCANDQVGSDLHKVIKDAAAKSFGLTASLNVTPFNQMKQKFSKKVPPVNYGTSPVKVYLPEIPEEDFHLESVRAVPLMSVIVCPANLRILLRQLCGHHLLVASMEVGKEICGKTDFDCVTPDGDRISRQGSVQGGYRRDENWLTLSAKLKSLWEKKESLRTETADLSSSLSALQTQLYEAKRERDEIQRGVVAREETVRRQATSRERLERQLHRERLALKELEGSHAKNKQSADLIQASLAELKNVLSSDRREKFREDDKNQMGQLGASLSRWEREIADLRVQKGDCELAQDTLAKSIEELRQELATEDARRLETYQKSQKMASEIGQLETGATIATEKEATLRHELEELTEAQAIANEKFADMKRQEEAKANKAKEVERQRSKLQMALEILKGNLEDLEEKEAAHTRRRQNAGVVDCEELRGKQVEELQRLLRKCEEELRDIPKLNKKVVEDLQLFKEKFLEAGEKRAELRESLDKVKELMLVLNARRSRTLRKAFDEVNRNLQLVFATLVPGGRAKLVIQKLPIEKIEELRLARQQQLRKTPDSGVTPNPSSSVRSSSSASGAGAVSLCASSSLEDSAWRLEVGVVSEDVGVCEELHWDEVATGIQVKASFRRGGTEKTEGVEDTENAQQYFPIMALSGGQKTVVALALIFAMQKCDKAPFYILDEVDAALDETYRAALANLIQQCSQESQFLLTTFRKELCAACENHFEVVNDGREAQITRITREQALEVLQRDDSQDPALALPTLLD